MTPIAKGKKRRSEIADDEAAIKEFDAKILTPRKKSGEVSHPRDEVSSVQVRNIMADEIEAIAEETGTKLDRLNAYEFYAFNLWLELHVRNGITARDQKVPMVKCSEHA